MQCKNCKKRVTPSTETEPVVTGAVMIGLEPTLYVKLVNNCPHCNHPMQETTIESGFDLPDDAREHAERHEEEDPEADVFEVSENEGSFTRTEETEEDEGKKILKYGYSGEVTLKCQICTEGFECTLSVADAVRADKMTEA